MNNSIMKIVKIVLSMVGGEAAFHQKNNIFIGNTISKEGGL